MTANSRGMRQHVKAELQTELHMVTGAKSRHVSASTVAVKAHVKKTKSRLHAAASTFASELANPFGAKSIGCKVPDLFSFPTSSYHFRGNVVLNSVSNGTAGGVFLPNPLTSFIDTPLDVLGLTGVTSTSMARLNTQPLYGATNLSSLTPLLQDYRVSSWGIRITNLQPALSATGRLYVAIVPAIGVPFTPAIFSTTGSTPGSGNVANFLVGSTASTWVCTADVLDLTIAQEVTVSDMMSGVISVAPPPINTTFYDFKSLQSNTTYLGGFTVSNETLSSSGGTTLTTNEQFMVNGVGPLDGGCSIVVFADGLPFNVPAFEVEYIYHVEGAPVVTSTSYAPVASSPPARIGTTETVERTLAVYNPPKSVTFLDQASATIGDVSRGVDAIAAFAQSPTGQMIESGLAALFMM
jgi:hypothetical protein